MMLLKQLLVFCLVLLISGSAYGAGDSQTGFTDIAVSQIVTGHLADNSQIFDYKIYFKDSGGSIITGTAVKYKGGVISGINTSPPADASMHLTFPDGIGAFSLKHGQVATFEGIPSGWTMCVIAVRDALYLPKFTDSGDAPGQLGVNSTGERSLSPGKRSIAFTNDRLEVILTGIADIEWSDMAFVLMAGIIVLMCLVSVFIKRLAGRLR
jgi:hypothetical protein